MRTVLSILAALLCSAPLPAQETKPEQKIHVPDNVLVDGPLDVRVRFRFYGATAEHEENLRLLYMTRSKAWVRDPHTTGVYHAYKTYDAERIIWVRDDSGRSWEVDRVKKAFQGKLVVPGPVKLRQATFTPDQEKRYHYFNLLRLAARAENLVHGDDEESRNAFKERVKEIDKYLKDKSLDKDFQAKSLDKDSQAKSPDKDSQVKSLDKAAQAKSLDKDSQAKSLDKDAHSIFTELVHHIDRLRQSRQEQEKYLTESLRDKPELQARRLQAMRELQLLNEDRDAAAAISAALSGTGDLRGALDLAGAGYGTILQADYVYHRDRVYQDRDAQFLDENIRNKLTEYHEARQVLRQKLGAAIKELGQRLGLPYLEGLKEWMSRFAQRNDLLGMIEMVKQHADAQREAASQPNPWLESEVALLTSLQPPVNPAGTATRMLDCARKCTAAAEHVPPGAFYDTDRAEILTLAAAIAALAANMDYGQTSWKNAYHPYAAYALRLYDYTDRFKPIDINGSIREYRMLALALAGQTDDARQLGLLLREIRASSFRYLFAMARLQAVKERLTDLTSYAQALAGYGLAQELKRCQDVDAFLKSAPNSYPALFDQMTRPRIEAALTVPTAQGNSTFVLKNISSYRLTNVSAVVLMPGINVAQQVAIKLDSLPPQGTHSVPISGVTRFGGKLALRCTQGEIKPLVIPITNNVPTGPSVASPGSNVASPGPNVASPGPNVASVSGTSEKPGAPQPRSAPPEVFQDFEAGTYGTWVKTGDAFGNQPATGSIGDQQPVSGFGGRFLANTFLNRDNSTGTLTSPSFAIKRPYIQFRIGGGDHPGRACINLMVGGKQVRTATGKNSERLEWSSWDVKEFTGQNAVIVIVDQVIGDWAHILIDDIQFADEPPRN